MNHRACGLFYWPTLARQARLEGVVSPLEDRWADDDFQKKTFEQQLAISLCIQSGEVVRHRILKRSFTDALENSATRGPMPTPPYWRGFLLAVERIEFLKTEEGRLNKRVVFEKTPVGWTAKHLQP